MSSDHITLAYYTVDTSAVQTCRRKPRMTSGTGLDETLRSSLDLAVTRSPAPSDCQRILSNISSS